MWYTDGSLHDSFPGFIRLLDSLHIDIALIQEPRTPVSATLPANCGFHYVGLDGTGGRDAGILVRSHIDLIPIPGVPDVSNIIWCSMPSSPDSRTVVLASFWAPHVGCPESERLAFWARLATMFSIVRQHIPNAIFFVAGDPNLWIPELVPSRGSRAADRSCRAILNSIIADFALEIANPPNQATHGAGAALDIVLASPGLIDGEFQVHNGSGCLCINTDTCCPALGSDHFLLTAPVFCGSDLHDAPLQNYSWPYVRDWQAHLSRLETPIRRWHDRVLNVDLNNAQVAQKRQLLDSIYSELCNIVWHAAPPSGQGRRRQRQPDWWTDDCYDSLVHRNTAWRERRRSFCGSTDAAFRAARTRFHRTVRRARESFWESWLAETELLAMTNPRAGAQRCRQQFTTSSRDIPLRMSWHSPLPTDALPGRDAMQAEREQWREHFSSSSRLTNDFDPAHHARISRRAQRLRGGAHLPGSHDGLFALAEMLRALSHCEDGAVGPDGIPYKALRVDLSWWQSCLLDFFRLVHRLGCVPSVW